MGTIFISYRREDIQAITERIYEHLSRRYCRRSLFKDVENIPAGVDYRTHIDNEVKRSAVMLAIIGPHWLSASKALGHRRLDDPTDSVFVEISSALGKLQVIPVLVRGARMPTVEELPPALEPLAFINAVPVGFDPAFAGDFARLRQILQPIAGRGCKRWIAWLALAAMTLVAVVGIAWYALGLPSPASIPREGFLARIAEYPQPKKTVWLDQNVSREKLSWFYHTDLGTRTFGIPCEWFMALEQPVISLTAVDLFSNPAHLDRYGFIPDTTIPGKRTLPIGFTRGGSISEPSGQPWRNPATKGDMTGIGLTCAACHTGRFTYKDTAVIIDGGSALTDLYKLKQGMSVALFLTRFLPGRFDRFADSILGSGSADYDRETLRDQLVQVLNQYQRVQGLERTVASQSIEEGYGRLDALNQIGNQIFSIDLNKPENFRGSSAPVHYPSIWNTPWFDWGQYNGSIKQPMARNVGKSLGVSAELNLTDPSKGLFKSSLDIKTLYEIERMVAGDPPNAEKGFSGLKSPKWPSDILPRIDERLAAQGAELYKTTCQGCHRPPVTGEVSFDFNDKELWTTNLAGQPILKIENIPISHVGTDPMQAAGMIARTVSLPADLGIKFDQTGFGFFLGEVNARIVDYAYAQQNPRMNDKDKDRFNGNLPNEIRTNLEYKARLTASGRHRLISITVRCLPATTCSPRWRSDPSGSISATANMIRRNSVTGPTDSQTVSNSTLGCRETTTRATSSERITARTSRSRASSGRPCLPPTARRWSNTSRRSEF